MIIALVIKHLLNTVSCLMIMLKQIDQRENQQEKF